MSPERSAEADESRGSAFGPVKRRLTLGLLALLVLGLGVRLYAATDDFWLDEILNYVMAMDVRSLRGIITGIPVEHQFLVTMTIYAMGDQSNWVWYRLPSVILGTGTMALMAMAGYRRMRPAALAATVALAGISYPLVVYSSEARGYIPASFFSLLAFILIQSYWEHRSWGKRIGFWASVVTAILYHPLAVLVYLGLGLWSLVHELRIRGQGKWIRVVREMCLCHAVPVGFVAWLYLAVMRHWGTVGGDSLPTLDVLGDTLVVALGLPMRPECRMVAWAAGSLLILGSFLWLACRARSEIWIFYSAALVLAPAAMLLASPRPYVYVRYFLVLFPFLYLMLGEVLDAAAREFKRVRLAVVLICIGAVIGNGLSTWEFLRIGRGGYRMAISYMLEHTPWPDVTVGGDHDYRNGLLIHFYRRYLPAHRSLAYLHQDSWPGEGPDWSVLHSLPNESFVPELEIRSRGNTYRLVESYPCSGLSGVSWHLYRNDTKFHGRTEPPLPPAAAVAAEPS